MRCPAGLCRWERRRGARGDSASRVAEGARCQSGLPFGAPLMRPNRERTGAASQVLLGGRASATDPAALPGVLVPAVTKSSPSGAPSATPGLGEAPPWRTRGQKVLGGSRTAAGTGDLPPQPRPPSWRGHTGEGTSETPGSVPPRCHQAWGHLGKAAVDSRCEPHSPGATPADAAISGGLSRRLPWKPLWLSFLPSGQGPQEDVCPSEAPG